MLNKTGLGLNLYVKQLLIMLFKKNNPTTIKNGLVINEIIISILFVGLFLNNERCNWGLLTLTQP